ncbi:MFS transporter [Nocardiopsis gilva YIM 90087]|uniref:MFS transporter n=1 Tax=Nocardiopsis gilva YIM 90087 TaxID=1235441 RepID=A0A223S1T2_9ACTN|nr:MFS transporter [Nocardiopsis gilva]ASU82085.1 MFS transporter [Nocardiopsis gilva YIM 90087]
MPLAVYVIGLGVFSMTTSEFMVSGLMPALAEEFGVSIAAVGYLITAYAAAMTLGGPVLTVGLLRTSRKTALLTLIGVFFLGQALGALSSGYGMMMAARVITGVASAAFFGVGLATCAEMVGPRLRGRAVSVAIGGLMIGTVLGLPAATLISQHFGWRASFWSVAVLVLLTGLVILRLLAASPSPESVSVRAEVAALVNVRLWAVYATSMLIIGATFAAFSYFVPILTDVSGFAPETVPLLLVAYGLATVVGNAIVGRLADDHTLPVLAVGLIALTAALVIFAAFAEVPVLAVAALILIGLVGVTMNPAMAARVMRVGNDGALVNTVHSSVITTGVVIGSWGGGLVISAGYGLTAPLWLGAGVAVLGLLSLLPELVQCDAGTGSGSQSASASSGEERAACLDAS